MNSKREFKVVVVENGCFGTFNHTLEDLIKSKKDYEYLYSLRDDIDKVLDLKEKESMYFQPNRDNELAKGIICRIK